MAEHVSPRLVNKISTSKIDKEIKQFIVEAIREEFSHADQLSWHHSDFYKDLIEKHSETD